MSVCCLNHWLPRVRERGRYIVTGGSILCCSVDEYWKLWSLGLSRVVAPWQGSPGREEIVGDFAETEQCTTLRNDRQNLNWPEKLLIYHSAVGPLEVKYSFVLNVLLCGLCSLIKIFLRFSMIVGFLGVFFLGGGFQMYVFWFWFEWWLLSLTFNYCCQKWNSNWRVITLLGYTSFNSLIVYHILTILLHSLYYSRSSKYSINVTAIQ